MGEGNDQGRVPLRRTGADVHAFVHVLGHQEDPAEVQGLVACVEFSFFELQVIDAPAGLLAFLDKVFHVNAAWALVLADIIPAWWMLCWFSRELVQLPMVPWLWSPFWHGRVQAHHADRAGKALSVALAVAFFAVLLRPWWPGLGWIASTLTPAVGAVGVAVGCAYILRSRRLQGPPSVALQAPG